MSDETKAVNVWNEAGKTGAKLGLLCIACMAASFLISKIHGGTAIVLLVSVLNFIIWAVKFTGCIAIMRRDMTRFAMAQQEDERGRAYRFGVASALLSALIVSAATLANILFISPEMFQATIDAVMNQYSAVLDANGRQALESVSGNLPTINFFVTLGYCFVYGWILSAILSRSIRPADPFKP